MSRKLMHGRIVRFGPREFPPRQEHLKFPKNSIGIYGWDLQNLLTTILLICLSTGEAGGHMVPGHWVIWLVTLWILFTESFLSCIPILLSAALRRSGKR